jgi:hypothetical protein
MQLLMQWRLRAKVKIRKQKLHEDCPKILTCVLKEGESYIQNV